MVQDVSGSQDVSGIRYEVLANHAISCMIFSCDCQFLSHDFFIHMSVFSKVRFSRDFRW